MRQHCNERLPAGRERAAQRRGARAAYATRRAAMAAAMYLAFAPAVGNGGQTPPRAEVPSSGPATTQKAADDDRPMTHSLKVVTYNVRECRYGLNRISTYLGEQDADVIFLQEVLRRDVGRPVGQAETLARLLGGYHWISGDTLGLDAKRHCDVVILARLPLSDVEVHDAPSGGRVYAISATIAGLDRPLRLMCVHTRSTSQLTGLQLAKSAGQRFAEIASLLEYVRAFAGDMLVAGDFNATPWMPEYASVSRALADLSPERSREQATFPAYRPSIRIDYLFGRGDVSTVSYEVGSSRLSDHLPLIATLSLRKAEDGAAASQPTSKQDNSDGKKSAAIESERVSRTDGTSRRPDRRYGG